MHCVADFAMARDVNNPQPCICDGRTRNAACKRNNQLTDGYRYGEVAYHETGGGKWSHLSELSDKESKTKCCEAHIPCGRQKHRWSCNCDFWTEVTSWHCNTVTEYGMQVKGINLENSEGGLKARRTSFQRGWWQISDVQWLTLWQMWNFLFMPDQNKNHKWFKKI